MTLLRPQPTDDPIPLSVHAATGGVYDPAAITRVDLTLWPDGTVSWELAHRGAGFAPSEPS